MTPLLLVANHNSPSFRVKISQIKRSGAFLFMIDGAIEYPFLSGFGVAL